MVADALSPMFDGQNQDTPEVVCAGVMQSLPIVYSSLEEYQAEDEFCKNEKRKIEADPTTISNFCIHKKIVCFFPNRAKRRRWVVPATLRPMLLSYFNDSAMAGHLGSFKTFCKIAANIWWPQMSTDVFRYVRMCVLCQGA